MNSKYVFYDQNATLNNVLQYKHATIVNHDMTAKLEQLVGPSGIRKFLRTYDKIPVASFRMAIQPLFDRIENLRSIITAMDQQSWTSVDNSLTQDEHAALRLYTFEHEQRERSFSVILNVTIQTSDEYELEPWFLYLRLLARALDRIPNAPNRRTVYRAAKLNLTSQYSSGKVFSWWSPTSCTILLDKFNKDCFLGRVGPRTLFVIDCSSVKFIGNYLSDKNKDEFILPLACIFEVTGSFSAGHGFNILHLKEISMEHQAMNHLPKLPALKLATNEVNLRPIIKSPDSSPRLSSAEGKSSKNRVTFAEMASAVPKSQYENYQVSIDPILANGEEETPKEAMLRDMERALRYDFVLKSFREYQRFLFDSIRKTIVIFIFQNLDTVDLSQSQLTDEDMKYFANGLRRNTVSIENRRIDSYFIFNVIVKTCF